MTIYRTRSFGFIISLLAIPCLTMTLPSVSEASDDRQDSSFSAHDQSTYASNGNHDTLLPTHRVITGVVEGMTEDHAKVNSGDTGEISPRYLSLERAKEKGFTLKDGDNVEIVVNAKNHVVDYYVIGKEVDGQNKVIKGFLDQPLPVGQEHAMIKMPDGNVEAYQVRPLARSEVAAIPFDTEGLFLIDETNKIASATLSQDVVAEYDWARSTAYNTYRHVEGVIQEKPSEKELIIQKDKETISFPVWKYLKNDLTKLSKGMKITLLIDRHDKVVDISYPDKELN